MIRSLQALPSTYQLDARLLQLLQQLLARLDRLPPPDHKAPEALPLQQHHVQALLHRRLARSTPSDHAAGQWPACLPACLPACVPEYGTTALPDVFVGEEKHGSDDMPSLAPKPSIPVATYLPTYLPARC